jgi:hypothetical protein
MADYTEIASISQFLVGLRMLVILQTLKEKYNEWYSYLASLKGENSNCNYWRFLVLNLINLSSNNLNGLHYELWGNTSITYFEYNWNSDISCGNLIKKK